MCAHVRANYFASWIGGMFLTFMTFFVAFGICQGILVKMTLRNLQFPLNYSDVGSIFGVVTPMTIDHNTENGGTAIFDLIETYYGE